MRFFNKYLILDFLSKTSTLFLFVFLFAGIYAFSYYLRHSIFKTEKDIAKIELDIKQNIKDKKVSETRLNELTSIERLSNLSEIFLPEYTVKNNDKKIVIEQIDLLPEAYIKD